MNVALENAEIFGSVLSGELDLLVAAGGAAEMLPVSLSCPLPLLSTHPLPLLVCCFSVFCGDGSNQYSIRTAKTYICLRSGWKLPLWYNSSFSCIGNMKFCIASCLLLPKSMETKQDPKSLFC
jgi:hypothetical protein